MKELIRRLSRRPLPAFELLIASFFVALLNLASPLFVIQVLNRYVAFGFDGTLFTLTMGMLAAVILLFGFRTVRSKLAAVLGKDADLDLAERIHQGFSSIKTQALDRFGRMRAREIPAKQQQVETAYDGPNISALLDAPFSLLYILAVLFLSPLLALIGVIAMGLSLIAGRIIMAAAEAPSKELADSFAAQRGHAQSALLGSDTVRAFRGGETLGKLWSERLAGMTRLRLKLSENNTLFATVTGTILILMSVFLYAFGAMQVVEGTLTVGALIGANILTARAVQNSAGFIRALTLIRKARAALEEINEFLALPTEPESGGAVHGYTGRLEVKDLGFAFPQGTGPLFESLSLKLEPGDILSVTGFNGSGKTTFIRLLVGLLEPGRGEILVQGVNLRQISPDSWRKQIMYIPQEPVFFPISLKRNILLNAPDMEEARLNEIIHQADLNRFLFSHPLGLSLVPSEGGRNLPVGIRKRLALARALTTDGPLILFDEPTDGMDPDGCRAVYACLNRFAAEKRTMVIVGSDPSIVKASTLRLDFSAKPVPAVEKAPTQNAAHNAETGNPA